MTHRTHSARRISSRSLALAAPVLLAFTLSGCIAKTAIDVATLPVKAGSKVVDWTTTSQSESDRNRGRAMRKQDGKLGKLEKQYNRHMRDCDKGDEQACIDARNDYAAMQQIRAR